MRTHLATFLERAEAAGGLPAFVRNELLAYLDCGQLAKGFARVRCDACGHDRLVAFSCKGRAFCPSCGGRRMADTAAWLVDHVLLDVPVRQWVLTLPWQLRRRVAYDSKLCTKLLGIFIRTVGEWLASVVPSEGKHGAVTFIQRAGSALNLNPHFHSLVPNGLYALGDDGEVRFHEAPPPSTLDVEEITTRIAERITAHLRRIDDDTDPEELALNACADASVGHRKLLGPGAGGREDRVRSPFTSPSTLPSKCATVAGFNLHAGVSVPAGDTETLERLARYVARSPVANERLHERPDGRIALDFHHRWRDGTTGIVLDPLDLIGRLAALVPPPRQNLVRYHGAYASASPLRPRVIGQPPAKVANARGLKRPKRPPSRRRLLWAELMRRVFGLDVLECPKCGGQARVVALIDEPTAIRAILRHLGLPTSTLPLSPARGPPDVSEEVAA